MSERYHELDPEGDLVLVLNASSPIANQEASNEENGITQLLCLFRNRLEQPSLNSIVEPLAACSKLDAEKAITVKRADADLVISLGVPAIAAGAKHEPCDIRIRVSSKHLTRASPVFKAMLQVKFKEGALLRSQGHAELLLPDDHPVALGILLTLVHGQTRTAPRKTDLAILRNLAILVDEYSLFEAAEILQDEWIDHLRGTVPERVEDVNDDLLSWMCISWVFKKPVIFKQVTKIVHWESIAPIEADDMPIPKWNLGMDFNQRERYKTKVSADKIEERRQLVIVTFLQTIFKTYTATKSVCPRGKKCDAMVLGFLTMGLSAINLWPPPPAPYKGVSIRVIFQQFREMEIMPEYCEYVPFITQNPEKRRCPGIRGYFTAKVEELSKRVQGVVLEVKTSDKPDRLLEKVSCSDAELNPDQISGLLGQICEAPKPRTWQYRI